MTPEEIMLMNWLVDNVEGEIPDVKDMKDEAKSIVEQKGVTNADTSAQPGSAAGQIAPAQTGSTASPIGTDTSQTTAPVAGHTETGQNNEKNKG